MRQRGSIAHAGSAQSISALQSLSTRSLHDSGKPGRTDGFASSQSVPPQSASPAPSMSASRGVVTQVRRASLQLSRVHATPSLQTSATPGRQPAITLQVSVPVQNSRSSQRLSTGVLTQPPALSTQESVVQSKGSPQSGSGPATQSPPTHCSAPLQTNPS